MCVCVCVFCAWGVSALPLPPHVTLGSCSLLGALALLPVKDPCLCPKRKAMSLLLHISTRGRSGPGPGITNALVVWWDRKLKPRANPKYLFSLVGCTFEYPLQSGFPMTSSLRGRCRFRYLNFTERSLAERTNAESTGEQRGFFLTQVPASVGLLCQIMRPMGLPGQLRGRLQGSPPPPSLAALKVAPGQLDNPEGRVC